MTSDKFDLHIHNRGQFVTKNQQIEYEGGKEDVVENIDPDFFGWFDLDDIVRRLEYGGGYILHYKVSGRDEWKVVDNDSGVMEMVREKGSCKEMNIYIEHLVDKPIVEQPPVDNVQKQQEEARDNETTAAQDNCEIEDDDGESDNSDIHQFRSLSDSSEDEAHRKKLVRYPEFDAEKNMRDPELFAGLEFSDHVEFREAVRYDSLNKGYEYRYVKNEKARVTVVCIDERCKWRIHASWDRDQTVFQIKTYNGRHSCTSAKANKHATSAFYARKYLGVIREDPDITWSQIVNMIRRDTGITIRRSQAYRTKQKANEIIHGEMGKQYLIIRQYCNMILSTNPGSVVKLMVDRPYPGRAPQFLRIFVSLKACIDGFRNGCRPIIGLDGCHIRHESGGILLSAIGRDGNNQLFPIAWAVVEVECKSSWAWFIHYLLEAIGQVEERWWTFISDQQKGLVEVFDTMIPHADHRYCVRHMYANLKERCKVGKLLKDMMWKAASAYNERDFNLTMRQIEHINKEAYEWLAAKPIYTWTRSGFSPRPVCDMLTNNPSESWNKFILTARYKPIITMLETIRKQVMRRIQVKKEMVSKWNGKLCPRIIEKVKVIEEMCRTCEVGFAGEGKFEVDHHGCTWIVDLEQRVCGCRRWDISGIPCLHAAATINKHRRHIEDYVSPYFTIDRYKMAYASMVHPIPDPSQWPDIPEEEYIMPPKQRKQPGRPRRARKKKDDEKEEKRMSQPIRRKYVRMRCTQCKAKGHNVRTCNSAGVNMQNEGIVKEKESNEQADIGQMSTLVPDIRGEGDIGLGIQWDDPVEGKQMEVNRSRKRGRKPDTTPKLSKKGKKNGVEDENKQQHAREHVASMTRKYTKVGFLSGSSRDLGGTTMVPPRSGVAVGIADDVGRFVRRRDHAS